MSVMVAIWLAIAITLLTTVLAGPVLRRLPPPGDRPEPPTPWHSLPTPAWLAGLAAASFLAAAIGLLFAESPTAALWLVWAGPVALLIAVDAATTWLPLSLTRICAGLLALAAAAAWFCGLPADRLVVMAISAAATYLVFRLLWLLSRGGLGYGDVRLAPMVSFVAGSVSIGMVTSALILGSLAGLAWGILHRLRGRQGAFAYGPALWAGVPLALLASWGYQALMR